MLSVQKVLEKLCIPLLGLIIFFTLTTFAAYWADQSHWERFLSINWARVFQLLDLRAEQTSATWFSSILFLITAMGFALLGWGRSEHYQIRSIERYLFKLASLALCALSVDEAASIHETIGIWFERQSTLLNDTAFEYISASTTGFSWLLIFSPIFLLGLAILVALLYRLIRTLPDKKQRLPAYYYLILALLCLPSVLVLEAWQAHFYALGIAEEQLFAPCLEEACELLGMYFLLRSVLITTKFYQL